MLMLQFLQIMSLFTAAGAVDGAATVTGCSGFVVVVVAGALAHALIVVLAHAKGGNGDE
jgi:hypothetical protein